MGAMRKSTHTGDYALLREALAGAREAAGLSQRALARKLRLPHTWVAKVESGERRIDVIECGWYLTACNADALAVIRRVLQTRPVKPSPRPAKGGR
jgi:transcriptional regulator with XRE-family HTH domain